MLSERWMRLRKMMNGSWGEFRSSSSDGSGICIRSQVHFAQGYAFIAAIQKEKETKKPKSEFIFSKDSNEKIHCILHCEWVPHRTIFTTKNISQSKKHKISWPTWTIARISKSKTLNFWMLFIAKWYDTEYTISRSLLGGSLALFASPLPLCERTHSRRYS